MKSKTKLLIGRILFSFCSVILFIIIVFLIYAHFYYEADEKAQRMLISDDVVSVAYENNHTVAFSPKNPDRGLIFYPGAKVEYTAYAPLMQEFARNGFLCVVVKMPQNFAFLDMNAADKVIEKHPEIEQWYIGGHSLGGSMAASYAAGNKSEIEGVFLFAAYSTADISDMQVFSVYGSDDKIMHMWIYDHCYDNLPENLNEYVIEGANHSQFGDYGHQKNDGEAAITDDEQISMAVEFICENIER